MGFLQHCLKLVVKVNMIFNSDKFESLRFWPGKTPQPDLVYTAPDGTAIEDKSHLRDLGVEISNDLTFYIHIENTIIKGMCHTIVHKRFLWFQLCLHCFCLCNLIHCFCLMFYLDQLCMPTVLSAPRRLGIAFVSVGKNFCFTIRQ